MNAPRFAIVTRDELWSLERRHALESRLIHGSAVQESGSIHSFDDCDSELLAACERLHERVVATFSSLRDGHARVVTSARRERGTMSVAATISLTVLDISLVTTLDHVLTDHAFLARLANERPQVGFDGRALHVVWKNGSGAVLLHEAAGHPAEHGHDRLVWPSWLRCIDRSSEGSADLLSGESPRAERRETFTDVPLRRMTDVVVDASTHDVALPQQRLEIVLVAGGRYEPLDQTVSIAVAVANLVDGDSIVRVRPFTIERTRGEIAVALIGAMGAPIRYPGVICSREGQALFVASSAPDLVMEPA